MMAFSIPSISFYSGSLFILVLGVAAVCISSPRYALRAYNSRLASYRRTDYGSILCLNIPGHSLLVSVIGTAPIMLSKAIYMLMFFVYIGIMVGYSIPVKIHTSYLS